MQVAIKLIDQQQHGAVFTYNVRGGKDNDAIESICLLKKLMPAKEIDDIQEKMFISVRGVWGDEIVGGWVKIIDRSNPRNIKITINPLIIDELEEKEDVHDMDMDDNDQSYFERLSDGGIVIDYSVICSMSELLLPYPQDIPDIYS